MKVLGVPAEFGKVSVEPEVISFVLRGATKNLESLQPQDVAAYIEISDLSEGSYELAPRLLLPEGVAVKESLARVKVTLHRKA